MRLRLDKAPKIESFEDAKEVRFFSICGGKVVGALTHRGDCFEIRYHGTVLVHIRPSGLLGDVEGGLWTISDGSWPSMNTAAVIHEFLPEGYRANYKFNYRRDAETGEISWGRQRENERIILTFPRGTQMNLTHYGHFSFEKGDY